jgi:hypothetical protein
VETLLPVKSIKRARLDETVLGDVEINNGAFDLELAPHKIETLILEV